MPKRVPAPILDQVLQAWRVNSSINLKLIRQIPKKGFDAVPLASRGPTVLRQLTHMQKVHVAWLRHNGVELEGAEVPIPREKTPSRTELVAAFRASGRAVEKFVREKL